MLRKLYVHCTMSLMPEQNDLQGVGWREKVR